MADVLKKATRRDRLIILLDMTEALRPSELFAIRWRTFDGDNTLNLTETIYRGVIRPFGKTPKSLGKMHLPDDLVTELNEWKLECKEASINSPKPATLPKCSIQIGIFPKLNSSCF